MDRSEYDAIKAINWSTLKEIARSPLHYRHALRAGGKEPADAMDLGNATHVLILEPHLFGERFAIWTGDRRAGKVWDAFEADAVASGMTVLRQADADKARAIAEAVRGNPVASPYLDGPGAFEATIRWTDDATGLACKGRADRIAENVPGVGRVLVDLKTARDISRRRFGYQAAQLGYHAQLAYYRDGLAASGYPVDAVVIVAVESAPPHDSGVLVVTDDTLYAGQEHYRELLDRLARCRAEDRWPGIYESEGDLQLPAWVFTDPEADPAFGLTLPQED